MILPVCIGCRRVPAAIHECVEAARGIGFTPDDYMRREEGTYNRENGHFLCTSCYITAGMPSSPIGWKAP